MRNFLTLVIVIILLLAVFGEKDALYNLGSTLRQGVDAISDGYNDEPKQENER